MSEARHGRCQCMSMRGRRAGASEGPEGPGSSRGQQGDEKQVLAHGVDGFRAYDVGRFWRPTGFLLASPPHGSPPRGSPLRGPHPSSVAGASLCLRSLRTFLSNTVRAHSPHVAPAHDSPPPAIIIMPPDSRADLEAYSWTGERLAMKFEGGWSIGSFRRKVKRGEPEAWCTTCANFESARAR